MEKAINITSINWQNNGKVTQLTYRVSLVQSSSSSSGSRRGSSGGSSSSSSSNVIPSLFCLQ